MFYGALTCIISAHKCRDFDALRKLAMVSNDMYATAVTFLVNFCEINVWKYIGINVTKTNSQSLTIQYYKPVLI